MEIFKLSVLTNLSEALLIVLGEENEIEPWVSISLSEKGKTTRRDCGYE